MKKFRLSILLMLLVTAMVPLASASISQAAPQKPSATVDIQFLNVSDWHGQLDPSNNIGGASTIATYWKNDRTANPNTITLTAGDDFGASPPLSSFFNEVPAVMAERMMGIQINTFGNHNFDRGVGHLQQMIDLARKPTAPLTPSSPYNDGQPFEYVAANLAGTTGVLTGVLPYKILTVSGVKVAIIGLVNEEAPSLVKPGNFGGITITPSVPAAMAARAQAASEGAQVFVAITHKGFNDNVTFNGPLRDFANGVTGFDIIFGDHTNVDSPPNLMINGALVTENLSKGAKYLKVNLTFDTTTGTVTNKMMESVVPSTTKVGNIPVPKDAAIEAMLKPYRAILAQQLDTKIGVTTGVYPRGSNVERLGEAPVGNLVADAMRQRYNTQIALTNGGGLRETLPGTYAPMDKTLRRTAPGYVRGPLFDVTKGDIYGVLPFGNFVLTRTVSGGQLWQALEWGVGALPSSDGKFPQISGFKFTFNSAKPIGSQVMSVTLNDGTPILSDTTSLYTMATNDFTNSGGDGYLMFRDGKGSSNGETLADAVITYIQSKGTITPYVDGRILDVTRISNVPDQVLAENTATGLLPFTVTDSLTTTINVSASVLPNSLLTAANVVVSGTGANRTVKVTPPAGKSGVAIIALRAIGTGSTIDTFVVIVNDSPESNITDKTTNEDVPLMFPVYVKDSDTLPVSVTASFASSNPTLIPVSNIKWSGNNLFNGVGFTNTLTITPAANLSGTSVLTMTLSDGINTTTDPFTVTVLPINDAPTITQIAPITVTNTMTSSVNLTIGDVETNVDDLEITVTSSDQSIIPDGNIVVTGTGANRTVSFKPLPGKAGTVIITVSVSDGVNETTMTFVVNVRSMIFLPLMLKS